MSWFKFHDMHSGGRQKLDWGHIYLEAADEEQAVERFQSRFDRDPHNVTCDCCGEDYSISDGPSLAQVTGYERGCRALVTPRIDGRYQPPDDPWFKEHYWLEEGEEPKPPYVASQDRWTSNKYLKLEDYLRQDGVIALPDAEFK